MEINQTLGELGLGNEETSVYITLLKLGSSLASKISEETRINRSQVYQILDKLIKKGFVGYVIKNNKRYYNPVNPEKLIEIQKEREEKLKSILPQLSSLFVPSENKPMVEILEGKEGIKTILNDLIRTKKEWFALGTGRGMELLPYFVEHWQKERQKHKINLKVILDTSESGKKRGDNLSKAKYTEIKYMPKEYSSPFSTWIYGDRLVFVMWSKEHSFAIRIMSENIVKGYKSHFDVLWKVAKIKALSN
ncbi:MAG: helix-turn-helix domain-containing protein [Nanoarchaeota archaeon]